MSEMEKRAYDAQSKICIIISNSDDVVNTLVSSNNSDFSISSQPSIDAVKQDISMLNENSIIVYDTAVVDNNAELVAQDLIELKTIDPTQVIFVTGEQKTLTELLHTGAQPLIYRAFNKPIHPNQLFLSFGSAHELHKQLVEKQLAGDDLTPNTAAAKSKPNKKSLSPIIIGAIAIVLLLPAAFFLFGGSDESSMPKQQNTAVVIDQQQSSIQESPINDTDERVNELNQFAQSSILEGRLVSPANDNALDYYNQALSLNPYDKDAYEGKKSLVSLLRQSFSEELNQANFDKSLDIANALQEVDPFNPSNDELFQTIEKSVTQHISKLKKSGNETEIQRTAEVLNKIETSGFAKSKTAIEALKVEAATLSIIDQALEADNLVPGKKDNAFTVISKALKSNLVTRKKIKPRIKELHNKLVIIAEEFINEDNIDEASKYAALVEKLNFSKEDIDYLAKIINEKTTPEPSTSEESDENSDQEIVEVVEKIEPKIIPAKLISRVNPKYPKRAISKEIQGWVDVGFTINEKGVPTDIIVNSAEPVGVFEKTTIQSVEKWRFSPARNDQTGEAVSSQIDSTKLHFKMGK